MVISLAALFRYTLKDTAGLTDVTCSRWPDPEGRKALGAARQLAKDRQRRPPVPGWPWFPALRVPTSRCPERPSAHSPRQWVAARVRAIHQNGVTSQRPRPPSSQNYARAKPHAIVRDHSKERDRPDRRGGGHRGDGSGGVHLGYSPRQGAAPARPGNGKTSSTASLISLLSELPATPQVRAAAFRALAGLPESEPGPGRRRAGRGFWDGSVTS